MTKQEIQFATPKVIQDERPRSKNMVRAITMVSAEEAGQVTARGMTLCFEHEGRQFSATPQEMIPAESKILREDGGALFGISATVGG